MAKTEIKTTLKPNLSLVEPPMFKIIYLNDEVTSMEFVVSTLMMIQQYILHKILIVKVVQ